MALHPRNDIDRLPRKEKGRGLTNIEVWVDSPIKGFENYIKKSKEREFTVTSNGIGKIR